MSIFTSLVKKIFLYSALLLSPGFVFAQQVIGPSGTNTNGSSGTAITTAVPFLTITPDSRSGALGDAGVALSPDVNANYWNPSKLTFLEDKNSVSASYSPWLRRLVPDVNLAYLSYAHKLDERNSIGASVRYFNLGTIDLRDGNAADLGTYKPNEFSIDGTFARKFGENLSLGLTLRYIHSSLANGAFLGTQQTRPANAAAADVSAYYRKPTQQFGKDAVFALGMNISNIGTKISYTEQGQKYFLPTNLRIGAANTWYLDDFNELTVLLDVNKLLVPTPPIRDSNGNIISGKDDNRSVPGGIFGSFSDAPGGFSEELKEISYAGGLEYVYNKQFALRTGYFYENPNKGNRQYFTVGAGFKYDVYQFDVSYLVASQQKSPLANTLRLTLSVNFGGKK
ncbi:type IX secretion system outer membrane channel protein PorV [Mucilaginibacter koreensis]